MPCTSDHRPTQTRPIMGVWIMCSVTHHSGPKYAIVLCPGAYGCGFDRYSHIPGAWVNPAGWNSSIANRTAGAPPRHSHQRIPPTTDGDGRFVVFMAPHRCGGSHALNALHNWHEGRQTS